MFATSRSPLFVFRMHSAVMGSSRTNTRSYTVFACGQSAGSCSVSTVRPGSSFGP